MKKNKLILLTVLVIVALSACRKVAPDLINPNELVPGTSVSEIFKAYWHGMNNSYAFWAIDPTDWDNVYDEYLPKFEELDKQKVVETQKLKELYTEITHNLIDHHYSLQIYNEKTKNQTLEVIRISPAQEEVRSRKYYHDRMHPDDFVAELAFAVNNNIDRGRIKNIVGGKSIVNDQQLISYSFNIDNGIAYIYLSQFAITGILNSQDPDKEPALEAVANFQDMILTMNNLKGVIVDVRNNGGGYTNDMQFILGPMLGENLLIGYTRSKNGLGRLDYEPWAPLIISPAEEHRKIEVPIIALADLNSVSMAEITSIAIAELPNGYVVGERTWGGTGPLMGMYHATYGGAFNNNQMEVYTSTSITMLANGEIVEGKGVTPDIEVLYSREELLKGNDNQLERAIKLIHEKSK